jgi:hypothetical protein
LGDGGGGGETSGQRRYKINQSLCFPSFQTRQKLLCLARNGTTIISSANARRVLRCVCASLVRCVVPRFMYEPPQRLPRIESGTRRRASNARPEFASRHGSGSHLRVPADRVFRRNLYLHGLAWNEKVVPKALAFFVRHGGHLLSLHVLFLALAAATLNLAAGLAAAALLVSRPGRPTRGLLAEIATQIAPIRGLLHVPIPRIVEHETRVLRLGLLKEFLGSRALAAHDTRCIPRGVRKTASRGVRALCGKTFSFFSFF